MNIISQRYARSQKSVILNDSELGDIDFAVNLNIIANGTTIVNDRTVPDSEVISYIVFFSDDYVMTGFQVAANAATAVDNATFTNMSARANCQHQLIPPAWWVTQYHPIIDNSPAPEAHQLIIERPYWNLYVICHNSSSK
jgi:hypothetical protein